MGLDQIRQKIDAVDQELKELFLKRMSYVDEVYKIKKEENLPVRFKGREQEILDKKTGNIHQFKNEAEEFFKCLIEISCKYQEKALNNQKIKLEAFEKMSKEEFFNSVSSVCYQGILGSYSSEVSKNLFPGKLTKNLKTFKEVCFSVYHDESNVGILPIENLSAGSISEVYDLIEEFKLNIVYSTDLKINHCLLGLGKLEEIKAVKSHPQALSQCSEFINENSYQKINCLNTAVAAYEVSMSQDKTIGAICNAVNKEYYNVNLLCENIADIPDNQTRFVIISKRKIMVGNPQKISLVFSLPNEIGSLSRVLQDFTNHNLNLTKIESRPIKSNKWEYLFFVDVDGTLTDKNVKEYLENINYMFSYFRIVGSY